MKVHCLIHMVLRTHGKRRSPVNGICAALSILTPERSPSIIPRPPERLQTPRSQVALEKRFYPQRSKTREPSVMEKNQFGSQGSEKNSSQKKKNVALRSLGCKPRSAHLTLGQTMRQRSVPNTYPVDLLNSSLLMCPFRRSCRPGVGVQHPPGRVPF